MRVDPLFGTLEDFDALVARAHALGLRVLVDFIPGHTSSEHRWFRDSRSSRDAERSSWYVWADARPDGTPPNNWLSFFGGSAWQWEPRRGQYYLHHFHRGQPNLNLAHPEVVEAQIAQATFWLERGVDGLRLDAVPTAAHDPELRDNPVQDRPDAAVDMGGNGANPILCQRPDRSFDQPHLMPFLERLRSATDGIRPDALLMGEVGNVDSLAVSAKYTASGRHLHSCYHFLLLQDRLDAPLVRAVAARTEAALARGGAVAWATGNHDVVRLASRYRSLGDPALDAARARAAFALFASLRGGLCLYQGDELGLPEAALAKHELRDPYGIEFWPDFAGRDGCRTPMPWRAEPGAGFSTGEPWLPIPDGHVPLAVDAQERDPRSMLRFARALLRWRRGRAELLHGALELLPAPDPVVAFERTLGEVRTLCLFNLDASPARFVAASPLETLFEPGVSGARPRSLPADGRVVELAPFGVWYGARRGVAANSRAGEAP